MGGWVRAWTYRDAGDGERSPIAAHEEEKGDEEMTEGLLGGWVGGWVVEFLSIFSLWARKVEKEEAVRTRCCKLGVGWVGG